MHKQTGCTRLNNRRDSQKKTILKLIDGKVLLTIVDN